MKIHSFISSSKEGGGARRALDFAAQRVFDRMAVKAVITGALLDLDGTVYQGGRLIDGATEALACLKERGIPHRFITNTTSKSRHEILELVAGFGLEIAAEELFTPPVAAREVLLERGVTRAFLMLAPSVREDLAPIVHDEVRPQAVVLGDVGAELSYELLNRAFRFLLDDTCLFFTLARNRCFKGAEGMNLDTGAFAAALEYGTNRTAELIGKPAQAFYGAAVASLGVPANEVLMVGDDLESDVLGAQACGLRGVLVKTGKYREGQSGEAEADFVMGSIADLPGVIEASRKGR